MQVWSGSAKSLVLYGIVRGVASRRGRWRGRSGAHWKVDDPK